MDTGRQKDGKNTHTTTTAVHTQHRYEASLQQANLQMKQNVHRRFQEDRTALTAQPAEAQQRFRELQEADEANAAISSMARTKEMLSNQLAASSSTLALIGDSSGLASRTLGHHKGLRASIAESHYLATHARRRAQLSNFLLWASVAFLAAVVLFIVFSRLFGGLFGGGHVPTCAAPAVQAVCVPPPAAAPPKHPEA
eukprot:TRINITY_DN1055_c0_g1_i5.p1 TRINITY_DN1055_c0_g1~~TRINITY_DN1055_c0_g1_i5.p1  ORF type:complete len:197 (-),score=54.17 TRINITY_DN1055_c0_g1_i5:30-620(-)